MRVIMGTDISHLIESDVVSIANDDAQQSCPLGFMYWHCSGFVFSSLSYLITRTVEQSQLTRIISDLYSITAISLQHLTQQA
jgi:hypothetical protein